MVGKRTIQLFAKQLVPFLANLQSPLRDAPRPLIVNSRFLIVNVVYHWYPRHRCCQREFVSLFELIPRRERRLFHTGLKFIFACFLATTKVITKLQGRQEDVGRSVEASRRGGPNLLNMGERYLPSLGRPSRQSED